MLKTIRARASKGTDNVDLLVQKARTQAGVERILVVYDESKTAHIYVEGEPAGSRAAPRPTSSKATS